MWKLLSRSFHVEMLIRGKYMAREISPPPVPVRHGRLKRRGAIAAVLRLVGLSIAVVTISAVCVAGVATWQIASSFKPAIDLPEIEGHAAPGIGPIEGAMNFLLVGNDSGDGNLKYGDRGGAKLNDVTVLIHLSADHTHATIVTFPRDMFVQIPACPQPNGRSSSAMSSQKINTAYSYGGVPCVAATVTALTGVPIDYAADLSFDGAVAMADAVGGVEVCLTGPIRDNNTNPPLNLAAGIVELEGANTVSFLRTRYGVGDGSDLGRISNQQLFFAALVRQTRDQLSDPPTVFRLASAAAKHVQLTENLKNVTTLASMALAFKDIDFANIVFVTYPNHYPGPGEPQVNGVLPTTHTAKQLNDALAADLPVALTGGTGLTGATTLDPSATLPEDPPDGATTPPAATPGQVVELPGNAFGQTAAERTCSAGR